jgi:hypothetical protein
MKQRIGRTPVVASHHRLELSRQSIEIARRRSSPSGARLALPLRIRFDS